MRKQSSWIPIQPVAYLSNTDHRSINLLKSSLLTSPWCSLLVELNPSSTTAMKRFSIIILNTIMKIAKKMYDIWVPHSLGPYNNFMSFHASLVTLIRCATGEKWNTLMSELAVTNEKLNYRKRLEDLTDLQDLSSIPAYLETGK